MIPYKKFMNKIPKPVRKIGGDLFAASTGFEIFNQGREGSLTDKAMNKIDRFVGSKTRIKSSPYFIQDTDIGKRSGEYLMKKIKSLGGKK